MDSGHKIAVVGAGISGIVSAYVLSRDHEVTLFEKNSRLGGHTNTIVLDQGPDAGTAVDTGFIVCNDKTYPNFHKFLSQLGVRVRPSCMSFGYYCEDSGVAYAGTDLNGLLARRTNALSLPFWKMLWQIKEFSEVALSSLDTGGLAGLSLGEFLDQKGFGSFFRRHYLVPISAAIWSSSDKGVLDFPAEMFVRFFRNHGLLSVQDRPNWQTVVGGSHSYLRAFESAFRGEIRLNSPVRSIRREDDGVVVSTEQSNDHFDKVIIAAHADQTLKLLEDPSPEERRALGAWSYSKNRTLLHTHDKVLPPNRRAWASWNYRRLQGQSSVYAPVAVTYHMNRLQGLKTQRQYCVSLNPEFDIPDSDVLREIHYEHPIFTTEAMRSQPVLSKLSGERHTFYCGAYLGNGFHEDGVNSALAVAKKLGASL